SLFGFSAADFKNCTEAADIFSAEPRPANHRNISANSFRKFRFMSGALRPITFVDDFVISQTKEPHVTDVEEDSALTAFGRNGGRRGSDPGQRGVYQHGHEWR